MQQSRVGKLRFEAADLLLSDIAQLIAAVEGRRFATPFRQVRIAAAFARTHRGPIDRFLEARTQPGLFAFSTPFGVVSGEPLPAASARPETLKGTRDRALLLLGFATAAAQNGASERSIMTQTGHRSLTMLRRYIREGSLFRDNAAAKLGL